MLIQCPECLAKISSDATTCPKCAKPIKESLRTELVSKAQQELKAQENFADVGRFGCLILIFGFFALVIIGMLNSTNNSSRSDSQKYSECLKANKAFGTTEGCHLQYSPEYRRKKALEETIKDLQEKDKSNPYK